MFSGRAAQAQGDENDIDLSQPVDLVVLAVKERAARCRLLGKDRIITLRSDVWRVAEGQILTVRPRNQWRFSGHPYLSGEIESARIDAKALGLVPLERNACGSWDPSEEYWGEDGEPVPEWAEPIIARGPRALFEMEQVLPGQDPEDCDSDPILEANDRKVSGDVRGAQEMLSKLLEADLRCLDAHAHLGNIDFAHSAKSALNHYDVGVRIGELSLGDEFDGVLSWGLIDNRPFLRCVLGYGLCLWRLERFEEAGRVFERMLWMNPSDNQGIRALVPAVRARESWTDAQD